MEKKMKGDLLRRLLAVVLALTVAVTFVPLLGDIAYAEGDEDQTVEVEAPDANATDSVETTDKEAEEEPSDVNDNNQPQIGDTDKTPSSSESNVDVTGEENAKYVAPEEDIDSSEIKSLSHLDLSDKMQTGTAKESSDFKACSIVDNSACYFAVTRKGRTVYINGYFKSGYTTRYFGELYIDNNYIGNFSETSKVNKLDNLYFNFDEVNSIFSSTGYHKIVVTTHLSKGTAAEDVAATYRVGITSAPTASTGLEFYHNHIDYGMTMDYNLVNYKLFIEYSLDGKNWKTYGPISYYDSGSIYGLLANRNYSVRSYYGVQQSGTWFTGKEEGKFRYLGNYRTGVADKVKVKSITVKAYKVKKKKQKVYGYYTGLYLGKRTYYKYKLKIIVKLKKKPGTAGIWINGKKFKGNKKKYVVKLGTMTSYYKPKGKKYTVAIYKYHNASWGGYSPMYVKKKKIK